MVGPAGFPCSQPHGQGFCGLAAALGVAIVPPLCTTFYKRGRMRWPSPFTGNHARPTGTVCQTPRAAENCGFRARCRCPMKHLGIAVSMSARGMCKLCTFGHQMPFRSTDGLGSLFRQVQIPGPKPPRIDSVGHGLGVCANYRLYWDRVRPPISALRP